MYLILVYISVQIVFISFSQRQELNPCPPASRRDLGHFTTSIFQISLTKKSISFHEPTTGIEPVTSSLPRKRSTPELRRRKVFSISSTKKRFLPSQEAWSGRPGSNRRHSAWKADALPTELLPQSMIIVAKISVRTF